MKKQVKPQEALGDGKIEVALRLSPADFSLLVTLAEGARGDKSALIAEALAEYAYRRAQH